MAMEVLTPFALKRRLSAGQLADLVERATLNRRFDLSAVCDEFASVMNEDEAADWAAEFERSGQAPHLFTTVDADEPNAEEMFGGVKKSELERLSPEALLHLANKVADEQRDAKKKK